MLVLRPWGGGGGGGGGWRDSSSCFGSIPSVTKNSVLFVEELGFPQTTPN